MLVINNKAKERIGVFELEGNLIRVLDEDGDIDLNKGNILIFSYVTMEYLKILNKEEIEVEKIDVMSSKANYNANNEEIVDDDEEDEEESDDDVTKIKNLNSKIDDEDKDELKMVYHENLDMKRQL